MGDVEPLRSTPVDITSLGSRESFSVLVCRGCCCGTSRKHPAVDHEMQVATLSTAARQGGGRCRVVDCLDECSASNVVVVRRRDGHPAIWLGSVLSVDDTAAVADWLAQGAQVSAMPLAVARRVMTRTSV
jgi:hypothetical protein